MIGLYQRGKMFLDRIPVCACQLDDIADRNAPALFDGIQDLQGELWQRAYDKALALDLFLLASLLLL